MTAARQPSRPVLVIALGSAMIFPSILTWLYFRALAGTEGRLNPLQQVVYVAGKIVQFSFPIAFVWLTSGLRGLTQPLPLTPPAACGLASQSTLLSRKRLEEGEGLRTTGIGLGLAFGLLVVGLMLVVYFGFLYHSPVLASTPLKLRRKLAEFGVSSPGAFLGLGIFIAALHSLLEEYYWRWFVFGRLREVVATAPAIALSSLGFMAHHVIVLDAYLPGQFVWGVLPFSLGVAVGGAFWAWLYQRSGTLLGPWLSHLLVDAGIFVIGWDLLSRSAS